MRGETMKYALLIPLAATVFVANSFAQDRIYRCGNEYTNNSADAQTRGCRVVEGGNVTIVQGTRPQPVRAPATAAAPTPSGAGPAVRVSTAPQAGQRIDASEQRARDTDARRILEAELKRAEERHAELVKEYNNGEPERRGDERNYQKYLDRVAGIKSSMARTESDIASIKRELARVPVGVATTASQ